MTAPIQVAALAVALDLTIIAVQIGAGIVALAVGQLARRVRGACQSDDAGTVGIAAAACSGCGRPLGANARKGRCPSCWGQALEVLAPGYGPRLAALTSIGIPAPGGAQ